MSALVSGRPRPQRFWCPNCHRMYGAVAEPDPAAAKCSRCDALTEPHYAYCPKCGLESDYVRRRLEMVRRPYDGLSPKQIDDAIARGAKGLKPAT